MRRTSVFFLLCLLSITGSVLARPAQQGEDIRRIAQSVVLIGIVENGEIVGNGSGTIIDPTGVIYTNRHVVEDADDLVIFMLEDVAELPVERYRASPVLISNTLDFAIIQIDRNSDGTPIDPNNLNLPSLAPSDAPVDLGDPVRIFGYPGIGDGYMVVTAGEIVTIQNGNVGGERVPVWYRTDTEFSGGNSGGLAVNAAGEFIGLPTWVVTEDRTDGKLGGVLPITTIQRVIALEQGELAPVNVGDSVFTLDNASDLLVCFVFISPTTSNSWGEDQLGAEEVVQPRNQRQWTLPADIYDVLLLDCDGEELLDRRNVDLTSDATLTFDGVVAQAPQQSSPQIAQDGIGYSVDCESGVSFSNGVEFIIRGMPSDEPIRVTVVGLDGFDPVLAVLDTTTGDGTCIDDTAEVGGVRFNLPTTGERTGTTLGPSYTFTQDTGLGLADISVVVGGYNNIGGEFVMIVSGPQLTAEDQGTDLLTVRLTPGMVNSGVPLTVYMGGESSVDPLLYLADPETLDPFVDNTGDVVACDDANGSGRCWGESFTLTGSTLTTIDGIPYTYRPVDTMLSVPLLGLDVNMEEPSYFNIGLSSYQAASVGRYGFIIHASTGN